MPMNFPASSRPVGSDLAQIDAHTVQPHEYDELPELDEDMLARAVLSRGVGPGPEGPPAQ